MAATPEVILRPGAPGCPEAPVGGGPPLDALLVSLPFYQDASNQSPQLGLLYVASSLRAAGFMVRVLNDFLGDVGAEAFVDLAARYRPRILGIHVNTDSVPRVRRAIRAVRGRGGDRPLIVLGGPHVTIRDDLLLGEGLADIVVRGEGEETAVEIARWWLRGQGALPAIPGITYRTPEGDIVRNRDRGFIRDLDGLPEPDMDLLLHQPPYRSYQIITGRGCPFHCAFCAEGLSGPRYRFRSPASVVQEIEHLVGDSPRVYLGIVDDTFLVDRRRVESIARSLLDRYAGGRRLVWYCEGRVDFIAANADLFPLLRQAGLARIQIGVESGSQEILDLYGKGIRVEEIERAVAVLRDAGIPSVFGNFILGGARESPDTVARSIALAKRLIALAPGRMECSASLLAPFPGTAVAKDPARFGLRVIDPEMLCGVSLSHPAAVTERMGIRDILAAQAEFLQEVMLSYKAGVPCVPFPLIREHLLLRSYGLITRWSEIFLGYPCIRTRHRMLRHRGYRPMPSTDGTDLLAVVPHRTAAILDVERGQLAVRAHPRKILFNDMAAHVYELCSGKLSVAEIVEALSRTVQDLPPAPFLTRQVVEVLKEMDDRFLLVFSDL